MEYVENYSDFKQWAYASAHDFLNKNQATKNNSNFFKYRYSLIYYKRNTIIVDNETGKTAISYRNPLDEQDKQIGTGIAWAKFQGKIIPKVKPSIRILYRVNYGNTELFYNNIKNAFKRFYNNYILMLKRTFDVIPELKEDKFKEKYKKEFDDLKNGKIRKIELFNNLFIERIMIEKEGFYNED